MSKRVAQEIRRLFADEYERRPSETRRRAKARLVASIAEGLGRAQIADLRAGLSDGARSAFFDGQLSPAERQIVITALSHDARERAEMSSAAALLDCVDAEPIPLPPGLLARAATTFAVANSAARQGAAVGGQRAWRPLAVGGSLAAAFVLVVAVVGGLLSPGGQEMLAPSAEPTSSARATAETATKPSERGAAGQAISRAIIPPAEAIEKARSMSARGETHAVSCDDAHEAVGHDHGASEAGRAKDGAVPPSDAALEASCRSQAPPADNRSTKLQPRSDGPPPRTASSRQSSASRVGMVVDGLSVVPDGLFEIASRAVLRQLGKDLVDGGCGVVHHQMDTLRSSGTLSAISRSRLRESLSRRCPNHSPITTAYEAPEFYGPTAPRRPAHASSYAEELPPRPPLPVPYD